MSRWRALSLIIVHVLMIVHILQWWITGKTVSPVEPSEAMYTLNQGHLNAGFIFFALALLATLVLGRFFCGWGCHLVAYQDLCAWLLKKGGVKVRPFRSRLLVFAPLALALYMFVWPTAYRVAVGAPSPQLTNHMMTTEFWKTFPGLTVAIITFAICGFGIVYILGSKGFCTYACPYGGFFAVADQVAVGRIRVTDACEHCGHCTAVCTSNVRVHEEVAKFGMVVDPGCMKCMDCVSVCPNEALYFGFTTPPLLNRSTSTEARPARNRRFDLTIGEELLMVAVGLFALFAYRGLYGQIPLLLAMGMAAITGFATLKFFHMLHSANVKLQNLQFKRGHRVTAAGWVYIVATVAVLGFTAHSFAVQYQHWRGQRLFASANIGDEVWLPGNVWWESATPESRAGVDEAIKCLHRVEAWGLLSTPPAMQDLAWLYLAKGDVAAAEKTVRRLVDQHPNQADMRRGLAGVLRKASRFADAEIAYQKAIELDPDYSVARRELAGLLTDQGRFDDAISLYRQALERSDQHAWRMDIARMLMRAGRFDEAATEWKTMLDAEGESAAVLAELGAVELQIGELDSGIKRLRRALALDDSLTEARYNLALAMLPRRQISEAITLLERVIADKPHLAEAQYNLAVALFMAGRPAEALPHAREALRLAPDDSQAREFLDIVEANISGDSTIHQHERSSP